MKNTCVRKSASYARTVLSAVFISACLLPCFSQTSFQKSLEVPLKTPQLRVVADGSACYVADAFTTNSLNNLHVYKLDGQGNLIWHFQQTGADLNLRLQTLQTVSDGVVLLLNSWYNQQQSNSYLVKFNTDGSLAWSYRAGTENFTQLFDIQEDNQGNLWTSGLHLKTGASDSSYHFLSKLDSEGLPLASKQSYFRYFPNTGYEACRFTDLTWNRANNTLLFVEDFGNPYSQSAISSPNRNRSSLGYCDPLFDLDERLTGHHFKVLENADSTILFGGRASLGNFLPGDPAIGILDKTGKYPVIVKRTATEFEPLHSYSGDLVFFVPDTRQFVKFDRSLMPVWTIKLDNCFDTNSFDADIAADGSIFVVRNIDHKTIVARVLPDGSMPACISYPYPSPELSPDLALESYGYNPNGYWNIPFSNTPQAMNFTATTPETTDFCVKIDASFSVPDTICTGVELVPDGVDTTAGVGHTWDMGDFRSEDALPEIPFPGTGLFSILHRASNNICMDTASRFVRVVQRPVLLIGDTLVCGPATLTLDFSGQGATKYYLNGMPADSVIRIGQSGGYAVRLQNGGCFTEKNVQVTIVPFAPPMLPVDTVYCHGDTVNVALGPSFTQMHWDGFATPDSFLILDGAPHFFEAVYAPDTTCKVRGTYRASRKKCSSEQEVIYVPNVFSPGSGGSNAVFQVFPMRFIRIRSMQIFDRWGSLVYDYQGETPLWDGTVKGRAGASDVYTYRIGYLDERDASVQVKAGDVLLIR